MKKKCIGLLGASGNYRKLTFDQINQLLTFALKNYELIDISTSYGIDFNLINILKDYDLSPFDSKLIYKVGCNFQDSYNPRELFSSTIIDFNSIDVERIDSILFHRPSIEKLKSDIKFHDLIKKVYPKIPIGICTNSIALYNLYKENISIDDVQLALNPLDYLYNKNFLKKLYDDKISIQLRSILSSGLLTGKYNCNTIFKDPLRSRLTEKRNRKNFTKRVNMSIKIFEFIKKKYGLPSEHIPIFLYSLFENLDNVKCVVRGGSSMHQMKDNLKSFKIKHSDRKELFDLMETSWSCEYV